MRFIVISCEDPFDDEANFVMRLLDCGVDTFHLRRPGRDISATTTLLNALPASYHKHIVIHDHFHLCKNYNLKGVHINSHTSEFSMLVYDNPQCLTKSIATLRQQLTSSICTLDYEFSLSCSCHSLTEVSILRDKVDYLFLSPIFDSVSKLGYRSAFEPKLLSEASVSGIINKHIIALGGITLSKIPILRQWHFGGIALLGDIWNRRESSDFDNYVRAIRATLQE